MPGYLLHPRAAVAAGTLALAVACRSGTEPAPVVQVRLRNASPGALTAVAVWFPRGERRRLQPIDYVGETPLGPGCFTYELTLDPSGQQLGIAARADPGC